MSDREKLLNFIKEKKKAKTVDIADLLDVSRQRAHVLIKELVEKGVVVRIGSTHKSFYTLPKYAPIQFERKYVNKNLQEDKIFKEFEKKLSLKKNLKDNIYRIFSYSFSEMLNNAIEHSKSKKIEVGVFVENDRLNFYINDFGIGAFKNVMKKKGLSSELEAIQDILKGKTTTMPKNHSGQGIFFTSKMGDLFDMESFGYRLIVDNELKDVFVKEIKTKRKGTKINFSISLNSKRKSVDVFNKYSNINEESDYGFDRTSIKIKLYKKEGIYISRSEARRILSGLDKFKSIVLDFDNVETVGQAFVDEIFRVFHNRYPKIEILPVNTNKVVGFMINRVDRDFGYEKI